MSLKNPKKKFDKKDGNKSHDQQKSNNHEESTVTANKSKHIVFEDSDDEGNVVSESIAKPSTSATTAVPASKSKSHKNRRDASDIGTLWFQTVN